MKRTVQMAKAGVPSAKPGAPVVARRVGRKRGGFVSMPPILPRLYKWLLNA